MININTKECKICNNIFSKNYNTSKKRWDTTYFCSRNCYNKSKIGHTPWNKGLSIKLNDALDTYRRNGGEVWNKGKKIGSWGNHTVETRTRLSELAKKRVESGNHNFIKTGAKATTEREVIKKTLKYRFWRESVFKRDDYTCQICSKRGGKLNADHIKSFRDYPEYRLDINNGRTLCVDCHYKTDNYGSKAIKNSIMRSNN